MCKSYFCCIQKTKMFMKQIFLTLFSFAIVLFATSQTGSLNKKGKGIGAQITFHDFVTASEIRSKGISDVLNKNQWSKGSRVKSGLAFTYNEGLSDHFDFNARFGLSFIESPLQIKSTTSNSGVKPYFESDANIFMKLTSDQYLVSPFLSGGVGASLWQGYYAAYVPVGVGLQLNVFDQTFITLQSQYRLPVTANNSFNLFYSVGIVGVLSSSKPVVTAVAPPSAPVVVDTDKDGIPDATDKCPLVAGTAKYNGCPVPDTDKDGINDEQDKCPTVAGLAKYNGCPIPDSDNDGINDEQDKCPTVAGIAKYNGCPIPDTDGDGVNDEEDRCIDIPGVAANKGCPAISISVDNLTFKTGKSVLPTKGTIELDAVADILAKNPQVNILLEGHTDNTGSDKINDLLSVKRANAAKAYLVKKGVDESRMEATGFGSKNPAVDNATPQGRAKNRRVDVKVK